MDIFHCNIWIVEYLQRPIYIWNKVSKHIMSRCGMAFQSIPLHIIYNYQHFELIQYFNGLSRSLFIFQLYPKITIDLDDFLSLLKSMVQQPLMQLSQLATCFYWNENFDFTLIKKLKDNWDSPLEYVVSLFNNSCNTNITTK